MLPWVGHIKRPHGTELGCASRGLLDTLAETQHQPADTGARLSWVMWGSPAQVKFQTTAAPWVTTGEVTGRLALLSPAQIPDPDNHKQIRKKFKTTQFWDRYIAINKWHGRENRQMLLLFDVNVIKNWYLNKLDSDLLGPRSSEQEGRDFRGDDPSDSFDSWHPCHGFTFCHLHEGSCSLRAGDRFYTSWCLSGELGAQVLHWFLENLCF